MNPFSSCRHLTCRTPSSLRLTAWRGGGLHTLATPTRPRAWAKYATSFPLRHGLPAEMCVRPASRQRPNTFTPVSAWPIRRCSCSKRGCYPWVPTIPYRRGQWRRHRSFCHPRRGQTRKGRPTVCPTQLDRRCRRRPASRSEQEQATLGRRCVDGLPAIQRQYRRAAGSTPERRLSSSGVSPREGDIGSLFSG